MSQARSGLADSGDGTELSLEEEQGQQRPTEATSATNNIQDGDTCQTGEARPADSIAALKVERLEPTGA